MKHFFMEYGKIIVVSALTVTGLMFTTPFAEAVTGSVANFTTGLSSKYEPKELIDGDNVVLTDNDGDGVASKGDILTFKKEYLYQENLSWTPLKFRILYTDGFTAELVSMTSYKINGSDPMFCKTHTADTATDSNGHISLNYKGSQLDTALNITYFNLLTDEVKNKIQSKEITQCVWKYNGIPADATVTTFNGHITPYKKTCQVGKYDRKVYALDVQDVVDYLGTSFTSAQLNKMFTDEEERSGWNIQLRSTLYGSDKRTLVATMSGGYFSPDMYLSGECPEARPAFTITLREGIF